MDMQGKPAEILLTLEVRRASTGLVDTFRLVGKVRQDEAEETGAKPEDDDG